MLILCVLSSTKWDITAADTSTKIAFRLKLSQKKDIHLHRYIGSIVLFQQPSASCDKGNELGEKKVMSFKRIKRIIK